MRKALLLLLLSVATHLAGQTLPPIPERLVTIDCVNKRTDEVLRDIAIQGKFEFAWDARLFDPAKPVTLHVQQVTVRRAISLIFGNTIAFRVKGNYLVLVAAPAPLATSVQPVKKREFALNGYITDAITGEAIAHTSIYDSVSLAATLSDDYGHYELKLGAGTQPVRIKISREEYIDTFIIVVPSSNLVADVVLRKMPPPLPPPSIIVDSIPVRIDTLAEKQRRKIENIPFLDSLIGFEQIMQTKNMKETMRRNGQVSLLPFVSTNGMMGGAVSNKYSFNLIGGYTGGTSVAELGGVFNIDRGDVQWAQVAGGFNLVGGNTRGLQLAGATNVNFGIMRGLQLAGATNFLFDSLIGVQLAGGTNFIDGPMKGFQVAGGANIASKNLDGMQIAGGTNITLGKMNRLQLSGGLNYAGQVSGVQLAGGANVCIDTMRGAQIAVVNVAKHVKGVQVGIVNYAHSCSEGAPIGLISIVIKGLHELEVSSTERGFVNLALRTGTPEFYNVLIFGFDPAYPERVLWTFGYGIGHRFMVHPKFDVAIDLTAHHVNKGNFSAYTSEWAQLALTAEWRPARPFAIAAGPVLNYYITGAQEDELARFHQAPVYSNSGEGSMHIAWVGAVISLRFF
ncbi:MAG TPA: hypothetical protein VK826_18010 [Bacteroidia bacterium]|nr:hypothetical protein [Bacteroidia bacterium]